MHVYLYVYFFLVNSPDELSAVQCVTTAVAPVAYLCIGFDMDTGGKRRTTRYDVDSGAQKCVCFLLLLYVCVVGCICPFVIFQHNPQWLFVFGCI